MWRSTAFRGAGTLPRLAGAHNGSLSDLKCLGMPLRFGGAHHGSPSRPRFADPPAAERRSSRLGPADDRAPCAPGARVCRWESWSRAPEPGGSALSRSHWSETRVQPRLAKVCRLGGGRGPVLRCDEAEWLLPRQVVASSNRLSSFLLFLRRRLLPPAWHTRVPRFSPPPGWPLPPPGNFLNAPGQRPRFLRCPEPEAHSTPPRTQQG